MSIAVSSIAIVADAHLSGPGGPAGPLIEQLQALPGQGCRRLVLMGDLFQAWVGFRGFETADVRAVVAALRALRARGVRSIMWRATATSSSPAAPTPRPSTASRWRPPSRWGEC